MDELSHLLTNLQQGASGSLSLSAVPVTEPAPAIPEQEWQLVAESCQKRQREFACGRQQAHQLLQQLGVEDAIIGRDDHGCPQWPAPVVGSITHTTHFCMAALAKRHEYDAVGVDLEVIDRMEANLWPRLFTAEEIRHLNEHEDAIEQQRHAAILFCAKEALYKCDYAVSGRRLDFSDASISLASHQHELILNPTSDEITFNYKGHYAIGDTHVACVVFRPATNGI